MKIRHTFIMGVVLAQFSWSHGSVGFDASSLDWNRVGDDFVLKKERFDGRWKNEHTWPGRFCNGSYSYESTLAGTIKKLDLDLTEHGTVDVYADVGDVDSSILGAYRSDYTLCVPLRGWYGVTIERAELRGNVHFVEKGGGAVPEVRVRIVSTEVHRIRFARWLPDWFERFLTRVVNFGLRKVWASSLGRWVSEKISEELGNQLPRR